MPYYCLMAGGVKSLMDKEQRLNIQTSGLREPSMVAEGQNGGTNGTRISISMGRVSSKERHGGKE